MAKVAFGKLQLTKNNKVETFDFNGQTIEVKQYLPLDEKTQMFERIINNSADDKGFYNITKVNFWLKLNVLFSYTNISFTDKQKEDLFKLYDLVEGSGLMKLILNHMDPDELKDITDTIWDTIKNLYKYANSALGIMQALVTDYDNLNLEASDIQSKIADPENLNLIRDVLSKLG